MLTASGLVNDAASSQDRGVQGEREGCGQGKDGTMMAGGGTVGGRKGYLTRQSVGIPATMRIPPNTFHHCPPFSLKGFSPPTATHQPHPAAGRRSTSRVNQLIAHHPTTLSQTKPALALMLDVYGSTKRAATSKLDRPLGTASTADAYTWSEVLPVIRAPSKLGRRNETQNSTSQPTIGMHSSAALSPGKLETNSRSQEGETQREDLVVPLPKINALHRYKV